MMNPSAVTLWQQFETNHPGIEFVWLLFTTYIGTNLVRVVPVAEFKRLLKTNQSISVPKVALNILPRDNVAEGGMSTSSAFLQPDPRSFYPCMESNKATVMCSWTDKGQTSLGECPRSTLGSLTRRIEEKTNGELLVGFELEFSLLREKALSDGGVEYEPLGGDHAWCTMTRGAEQILGVLEEAVLALQKAGIMVQQFHAELAPGQWEFILPPDSPLRAVDALIVTRQVLMKVASRHGYRATLHPRLYPDRIGNGAHVHVSLNSETVGVSTIESFFAGIVEHFPSISAFTMPQEISYDRVGGGEEGLYVCWGWENRAAILRRISTERFEVKMMDGLANPYLGLSALLAAGLDGLSQGSVLTAGPSPGDPGQMSNEERAALGIVKKMPQELSDSLDRLQNDSGLTRFLDEGLVSTYLAVKRGELKVVQQMTSEEKRAWFISTY